MVINFLLSKKDDFNKRSVLNLYYTVLKKSLIMKFIFGNRY